MSAVTKTIKPKEPSTLDRFSKLLQIANVGKVYYVDDENNLENIDFNNIAGQISIIINDGNFERLKEIDFPHWDLSAVPEDEVANDLLPRWEDINVTEQKAFYLALLQISGNGTLQVDSERIKKISEQFPPGMLTACSPQEWEQKKSELQSIIAKGNKAIILFDESLTHAGGRYSTIKGQDLIVEVNKMGLKGVICTLLTNLIVDVNGELQFRDRIIAEREDGTLKVNDFFPLAKVRLETPEVFADGIRKVVLNTLIENIKGHTLNLIKSSYEKAAETVSQFDTYDFEDVILKTSFHEGVWEPETIIRICDIKFENELKKLMVENNYAINVNDEIIAAQPFFDVKFDIPSGTEPYANKYILRHDEIYDKGDVINSLRKPLENGDIFEIEGNKYILVSQACDMMVRATGRKAGLRSAKVVYLFRIETQTFKDHKEKKEKKGTDNYLKDKHALPYFIPGTNDVGVVSFTDYIIADVDLLDLCVFNSNGECNIAVNSSIDERYFSSSWRKHYKYIQSKLINYHTALREAKEYLYGDSSALSTWKRQFNHLVSLLPSKIQVKIGKIFSKRRVDINKSAELLAALSPQIFLSTSPNVVVNDRVKFTEPDIFQFPVKRIMKYKDAGAVYLLERYTRHLSRIAEPHDFAE
jgi:hypothetical protein